MSIAATGRQVTLSGMSIHRIVGGKITETWNNYDALTLLEQLGFLRSHTL
jgi:predicted ester cyclase